MKHYHGTHVKEIKEDGAIKFRLTEKAIDRYGEVVMPKGAQLKNYKKNPVVLWAHNSGATKVPIGKLVVDTIDITDDYLDAEVKFDEDGKDPFAAMIADKVRNGFLNTGSIGFKAIEISKEPVVDGQTNVTHKKWELLEFSIVPIPALPSALAQREWTEFAAECKKYDHPIDDIIDDYYGKTVQPVTRDYVEDRLSKMADWIEGLENKLNDLSEKENTVEDLKDLVSDEIRDVQESLELTAILRSIPL